MSKKEWLCWAEAVRLHYMSLEGRGLKFMGEAGFFLNWHHEMCENR